MTDDQGRRVGAMPAAASGPKLVHTVLSASNGATPRTVVTTQSGLSLVTDEPVTRGGEGTAPTPLETVIGALLGCSSVTFERAAKELTFSYTGIDFDASYTLDLRGLLGEADVRPHFQAVAVEARVHTTEAHERLGEVVELTERRCPVRNLLADAGIELSMRWGSEQSTSA
ncbi:MAG: OsmC family protein [Acidimicrobiales bacterium]